MSPGPVVFLVVTMFSSNWQLILKVMFIFKFSDEKIKLIETKFPAYQGLARFHWPDKNNNQGIEKMTIILYLNP